MEITKYISKKTIFNICIIIVILIILRILYSTYYTNENIEGFDLSDNHATDLLNKYKSTDAQLDVNPNNTNTEMQIFLWSNKIYNMENPTLKSKPIAFYKPNLTINQVQYAKLGDIVCQNSDYSLPSVDQFTLLVKKGTSDIQLPIRFDLMAEIDNSKFNSNYYTYSNYINESIKITQISESLNNCSSALKNLNSLIQNNFAALSESIKTNINGNYNLGQKYSTTSNTSGDISISSSQLIDKLKKSSYNIPIYSKDYSYNIPAGTTGYITLNGQQIDISVPAGLDSVNSTGADMNAILSTLPHTPYGKLESKNITRTPITQNLFSYIPNNTVIKHVISLCNDIKNIYTNSQPQKSTDVNLLTYLNLAPSIEVVNLLLTNLETIEGFGDITIEGFDAISDKKAKAGRDAIAYAAKKAEADKANVKLSSMTEFGNWESKKTPEYLNTLLDAEKAKQDLEDAAVVFADDLVTDFSEAERDAQLEEAERLREEKDRLAAVQARVLRLSSIPGLNIDSITSTTTLLELVIYVINNATITINTTTVKFTISDLVGINPRSNVKATPVGCYRDSDYDFVNKTNKESNRAFPNMIGYLNKDNSEDSNIQECANAASDRGDNYFGIQAGHECWTGLNPNYSKYGTTEDGKCGKLGDDWVNMVYSINTTNSLTITGFNNNIISNIPSSSFNLIAGQNSWLDKNESKFLTKIISTVKNFTDFVSDFINGTVGYFPLKIYKPIAPENYTSLGHVFCNITIDLQKIIDSKNVACVPSHCVKEMREWNSNDKIFEYNKNGKYFAIYFNPYTGTFISTNTQQLPDGKVCKVVACVKKCTAVQELEKADDCARKYYNLNKDSITITPLTSTLVSNQEEEFYLDKIKLQSDSITRLKNRAQQMQIDVDKATIVNREMNKSKLQNYVDVQKRNIDIIMKRLENDKNKIKTDVNIPLNTLKELMDMIRRAQSLSSEQKTNLLSKLANSQNLSGAEYNNNLNQILSSCPQYDLSGLVSKTTASDVCFGCDTPR